MQYVPPFHLLSFFGAVTRTDSGITLPLESFQMLLRAVFAGEAFDAAWYRRAYPDVAAAIASGDVPDEITHFVRFGYFENRHPRGFDVDIRWYEDTYKDVTLAIRSGVVPDARSHFNNAGYMELRAPTPEAERAFAHFFEMATRKSAAPHVSHLPRAPAPSGAADAAAPRRASARA